jgi:phosphoribosylformimino-5-aminoimidazole carboxamide ribonucleotide (ProFAR) isomerase
VRGWEQGSGSPLSSVLAALADVDVGAVVVTAIDRDGMLQGPDVHGLAAVVGMSALPVVASGGVRSVADLEALARLEVEGRRLAGVIVGTALVEGALSVEEAMAACALSG